METGRLQLGRNCLPPGLDSGGVQNEITVKLRLCNFKMETGRLQLGRNCLPPGLDSVRVLNNNKETATTLQLLGPYSQSATG